MNTAREKQEQLLKHLAEKEGAAVAFSGGVDSAYLAWAAHEALGEHALAVTALAHSYPEREGEEARILAEKIGIKRVAFAFDEFQVPGFAENPPDRCYHCKTAILTEIRRIANRHGISCVIEGSNMDDKGDYRPGMRAVREQGVESPLQRAGLSKAEIRELSWEAGLPTWNKESGACLASRVAYGEPITPEKLRMTELAEEYLRKFGVRGQLRVRVHGSLARLEVPEEYAPVLMRKENREKIREELKRLGFSYVTVDLQGYRMGSMNETLDLGEKSGNLLK